jgi:hypothetical protein
MTTPTDALLEDFRSHWQALLQIEAEVSRWTTVYAAALVLAAGACFARDTVLAENPEKALANPVVAAALLLLAGVNAVYILALAFKGYQCQQLRLYLYDVLGKRLRELTDAAFNHFELWQRIAFVPPHKRGRPEPIRLVYYVSQTIVPFTTSVILLGAFWYYRIRPSGGWLAIAAFAAVVLLTCVSTFYAILTSSTNRKWKEIVDAADALGRQEPSVAKQPS